MAPGKLSKTAVALSQDLLILADRRTATGSADGTTHRRNGEDMGTLDIFDLSGKTALVTGGAGGIGKAALGMAKAGANIAIADMKVAMGAETVREIEALGARAMFVECDVSDNGQIAAMIKSVVDKFGRLDIAFNNAGILGDAVPSIDEKATEIWDRTMAVNLNAVWNCCREEAKYMIPQRYGKIINTASMSATVINNLPGFGVGLVSYCVSKAAVKHLTKGLAMEWAEFNIQVNSISPGYIVTPLTQFVQENKELLELENLTTPMHRQGLPEELVGGVLFLASDASSFTTGTDLIMDGGHTVW
jgi:NAD(P)-dependent dehydrogenase (short-subunit alcohol dehydrogenase family)